MNLKKVKARKNWICDICGGQIKNEEYYMYSSERFPKYDKNDTQIGIEYIKSRVHVPEEKCWEKL